MYIFIIFSYKRIASSGSSGAQITHTQNWSGRVSCMFIDRSGRVHESVQNFHHLDCSCHLVIANKFGCSIHRRTPGRSAQGTGLLKKRSRPHVSESCKIAVSSNWTGNRRIQQWHAGPTLLEVGNTVLASNIGTKAWLDFPSLEFPPIDWFEPLVVLYLTATTRSTTKAFACFFLQQLRGKRKRLWTKEYKCGH